MPAVRQQQTIILLLLAEPSEAQPNLNGIDPWIRSGQSGVRDMHKTHFRTPIVFGPQKMQSQRSGGREVHS